MRAGQALVLKFYAAVVNSPAWEHTLLVITYDEHGGIYDHVSPPVAADDDQAFRRYGVRVPAFVTSPWVARGHVSHTLFDHTPIITTVLRRFCQRPDSSVHIGGLLTRATPRQPTA
jgi:phospholipase C